MSFLIFIKSFSTKKTMFTPNFFFINRKFHKKIRDFILKKINQIVVHTHKIENLKKKKIMKHEMRKNKRNVSLFKSFLFYQAGNRYQNSPKKIQNGN